MGIAEKLLSDPTGGAPMLQELLPQAERIAALLKARGETISVGES